MVILISVLLSLLHAIILFYNMKLISGVHFTKRDYISIIGIIISSDVFFITIVSLAVLFLFIVSILFMYFINKFMDIVTAFICVLIFYFIYGQFHKFMAKQFNCRRNNHKI